jgi:hypothetical protein
MVDPTFAQSGGARTVFTSHIQHPVTATIRLRDLTPETARPRIEQLLATTMWFNGKLATDVEVAHSESEATGLTPSIMRNARTDASVRMVRLGLTGSDGGVRYGLTFRQTGQQFPLMPDRASREIWSEWTTGWMRVRNAFGQTWNNVEGESTRPRLEQIYGRVGLLLNMPSVELSVTYARSSLNSTFEPIGIAPQRSSNHTLEGAVAFQRPNWDIRFISSYILAIDRLRGETDGRIRAQTLVAILRPINTMTITPAFTYRQEFQPRSGVRIDSPTASLAVSYQQSPHLLFSAIGNYSNSRSSDGVTDSEHLRWRGVLDWALPSSNEWTTSIGLEAGYNRLANRTTRTTDLEDISGLVCLSIAQR